MADVPTLITALGDYGFSDSTNTEKVRAIQGAIWAIERKRPWSFLEASLDLNFDGASGLATNMSAQVRAVQKMRNRVTGQRIMPMRLDDYEENLATSAAETVVGEPLFYYVEAGQVKLYPIPPSSTGRVRMRFLQWSAAINESSAESAILIPPRHFEVILFGALLRLMDKEDDPELAARFEAQFNQGIEEMAEDTLRTQIDEPDYVHVLDPDDYF